MIIKIKNLSKYVMWGGSVHVDSGYFYNDNAFRPVVCLSSTAQITWNAEEGLFNLD